MAEISLYLTNVNVSLGQTTVEQVGKEPFLHVRHVSCLQPNASCCHGAELEIRLAVDVACGPCKHRVSLAMSPQTGGSKPGKDFESVELGELDGSEEEQQPQREKVPRRIIHFSSGETMEEYSTDEEEDQEPEKKDLLSSPVDAVRKSVDTAVIGMGL